MFSTKTGIKLKGTAAEVRAIGPVLHRAWKAFYDVEKTLHRVIEICLRTGNHMEDILNDTKDLWALPRLRGMFSRLRWLMIIVCISGHVLETSLTYHDRMYDGYMCQWLYVYTIYMCQWLYVYMCQWLYVSWSMHLHVLNRWNYMYMLLIAMLLNPRCQSGRFNRYWNPALQQLLDFTGVFPQEEYGTLHADCQSSPSDALLLSGPWTASSAGLVL